MKSYPDNQMSQSVKKVNEKKLQSKDLKIIQMMYGKKATKKSDPNYMSPEMADYCTQLFFLS